MNKILTVPKLIEENHFILYAGNHFIGIPEINTENAAIKNINFISSRNKGLVELSGKDYFLKPYFYVNKVEQKIKAISISIDSFYIPCFNITLEGGAQVKAKIYADINEKGFVYQIESSTAIEAVFECDMQQLSLLRFNKHEIRHECDIREDKWLSNPSVNIYTYSTSFGLAFGGEHYFSYERLEDNKLALRIKCDKSNALYVTLNSDTDGASTTLIHLRRKGYKKIYKELKNWLDNKSIVYAEDEYIEDILNRNLFYNYFFAVGKDMETDGYTALTSRSPRYYVSGAFWERDSFLWSFPAIKLVDEELYKQLTRDMILMHYRNAGDHAHYIDGTVLYPGFELDEAASYFILAKDFYEYDEEVIKALEYVFKRIEKEYDSTTGLYKTFLMPSDDPSEYPFLLIDNVILWKGMHHLQKYFKAVNKSSYKEIIQRRINGIEKGIKRNLIREINGKKMFVWSADNNGNYLLYNDPPGNLGLLYYYDFVGADNEIFMNTIEYYYSDRYKYYSGEAVIKELACDHHPLTPSGLGLCGSILNPLVHKEAMQWLKAAIMDYGLLSESFDKNSGAAKTGVGFATGSGYLAYALYHTLIER